MTEPQLTTQQWFVLRLTGRVQIGYIRNPGWIGKLPLYLIKCPVHGVVTATPHGYEERLECPHCTASQSARTGAARTASPRRVGRVARRLRRSYILVEANAEYHSIITQRLRAEDYSTPPENVQDLTKIPVLEGKN